MNSPTHTARFGVFEADLGKRELRNEGRVIPLQQQPFSVLAVLLERAGDVVSREELQKSVWPADTFVDFDFGLNTAIKKIRAALGDSAGSPRFVETLPRKGYRFIAAVAWEPSAATENRNPESPSPPGAGPEPSRPSAAVLTKPRLLVWILGAVAILASAIAFRAGWSGGPEAAYVPTPLTSYEGVEHQPSFSPDASQIAFVWDGGKGQNFDIYTRRLDGGNPVRLTRGIGFNMDPRWSPDGN